MCGRLSSSCDVIPEELQVRFSTMCGERVEHINRRITNYRKVTILSCLYEKQRGSSSVCSGCFLVQSQLNMYVFVQLGTKYVS